MKPENPIAADAESLASISAILAHTGKARSFIRNEPVRKVVRNGIAGLEIEVNLTSYRSLPLSCIEALQLKLDSQDIDTGTVLLLLNGHSHAIDELPRLSHIWWFILDPAILFVPIEWHLVGERCHIEATLVTVEPYVTAGRFSFYHSAKCMLPVQ